MDETYIKVRGRWVYLYRAVDKTGRTVDFFLSRNRDVNAAKTFLRKAIKNRRTPTKITLDAYAASHRAVREMKEAGELPRRVRVRSSQYLNNLIEQDHRRVKQRIRPMLGFKRFDHYKNFGSLRIFYRAIRSLLQNRVLTDSFELVA